MSGQIIAIIAILGFIGLFLVSGGSAVVYGIGVRNEAVELETQFDAQVKGNMSTYDKVWKIITQKANISSSIQMTLLVTMLLS